MRFALTEEQDALKRQARRFLEQRSSSADVRRVMVTDAGFAAEAWAEMVQLGWTALLVPERHGGVGLGPVELAAVMEEAGASLACAPLLSTVGLATNVLLRADESHQAALLPEIAAGRLRAAVALAGEVDARPDADEVVLHGHKSFVVDGHSADLLLVVAGDGVYVVRANAEGLSRRARATLDPTRKLAELTFDSVRVPASARLCHGAAVDGALDRAKVALAAEQLGGAERCLALSVEYAKTRVQFGRPIGSFQAIKHHCADLLVLVESARSAVWWAAFLAATDDPELPLAASLARSYASEAYLQAAGQTIQIHGGMGFTWDHDAHLHLRRARGSATLLGDPSAERERLAHKLGLSS
ncbi:MAG: acyl-CoA dehydrogenase domain protein [Myxococcales bacterium]|nr:acyl-CoA dehydrogenase domain protein [Myxococcales bacterium]